MSAESCKGSVSKLEPQVGVSETEGYLILGSLGSFRRSFKGKGTSFGGVIIIRILLFRVLY